MDNGENQSNQTIPGVRVAPPSEKPVDATTNDVGAANVKSSVTNNTAQPQIINSTPLTQTPVVTQPTVPSNGQAVTNQSVSINSTSDNSQTVGQENSSTVADGQDKAKKKKEKKPKNKLARFYFFIILLLAGGIAFLWNYHQQQIILLNDKCTPVSTSGKTKELDLNSVVVQDLYGKVKTNIREDLANNELNDQMKVYLAYRQIATSDLYESNCNLYNSQGMEPFKCEITTAFVPKAFKADTLQLELKKLFGNDTNIINQNVQLSKSCVGGFQYIAERGEYVQGQCQSTGAILYRVDKKLVKATSTESTIELYEEVKYYGNEGYELSDKLVSGTYKYTFKLDMNYNYIYISKTLEG